MSLFFKAVLVEMDPAASWVAPLVSGRPEGAGVIRKRPPWSRPVLTLVGLLVAYYAFPVSFDASLGVVIVSFLLTLAGWP